MKVRLNARYKYEPVVIDAIDPKTNLKIGEIVQVIHPHGCPKPNTLNHCHVARADDPRLMLAGLVCCNSLKPLRRRKTQKK